ncbi:MAG: hypothetical protein S4CHLAM6_08130 [Chlamydiae bacterium]|nr:hypothetical protein [Chlamydiota bacterium]
MVIAFIGAAALLYPAKRIFFSMTGLNDYFNAANHILHLRVKKAAVSTVIGATKLCFFTGATYLACKPLLGTIFSANNKPSDISKFKGPNINFACRVLRHGSFVPNSEAEKISKFCQVYFKDYPVTQYDISKECILKLSQRADDAYKKWIVNDPLAAAYRTSFAADNQSFEGFLPLKNCTVENIAKGKVYDSKGKHCSPLRNKTYCEKNRIRHLKHIFEIEKGKDAIAFSNRGCLNFARIDLCQEGADKLKEAYEL